MALCKSYIWLWILWARKDWDHDQVFSITFFISSFFFSVRNFDRTKTLGLDAMYERRQLLLQPCTSLSSFIFKRKKCILYLVTVNFLMINHKVCHYKLTITITIIIFEKKRTFFASFSGSDRGSHLVQNSVLMWFFFFFF